MISNLILSFPFDVNLCLQTVRNPVYKESQKWLADKFSEFDYGNDARFETFKDYPKNKQLYQTHKDIARDYDKKNRFYRSCQKWCCLELNRQISTTQDRFSNLIRRTYASSNNKSRYLQYSYNKWVLNNGPSGKTVGYVHTTDHGNDDSLDEVDLLLSDDTECWDRKRMQSIRSVSVNNVTNCRGQGLKHEDDGDCQSRSRTSASVQEIRRPKNFSVPVTVQCGAVSRLQD